MHCPKTTVSGGMEPFSRGSRGGPSGYTPSHTPSGYVSRHGPGPAPQRSPARYVPEQWRDASGGEAPGARGDPLGPDRRRRDSVSSTSTHGQHPERGWGVAGEGGDDGWESAHSGGHRARAARTPVSTHSRSGYDRRGTRGMEEKAARAHPHHDGQVRSVSGLWSWWGWLGLVVWPGIVRTCMSVRVCVRVLFVSYKCVMPRYVMLCIPKF